MNKCDKCELLIFQDGTMFHELRCPNNKSIDPRDLPKLEAEKGAKKRFNSLTLEFLF